MLRQRKIPALDNNGSNQVVQTAALVALEEKDICLEAWQHDSVQRNDIALFGQLL